MMDFEAQGGNEFDEAHQAQPTPNENLPGAARMAAGAQVLTPNAQGAVVLPVGVSLDDITVQGRNLIITADDGTRYIILDGAIVVPQIVIDGVAVPPVNLAALLLGNEPEPAAGNPQSSGGNFAGDVDPLQAAHGIGDLLPYTELLFPASEEREVIPERVDREPDVVIQDGGVASHDVVDEVNENGLPAARPNGNTEAPGSAVGNQAHTTDGTIIIDAPDGLASVTINGITVTGSAGQTIVTPLGTLTLGTLANGQIPYTYVLADNTSGDASEDMFTVMVTDIDGDQAEAHLTIDIIDDVPTARNDTDSVTPGSQSPELGNVITGANTTSGSAGADTRGADGAMVTGIRAGTSGNFAAAGSVTGQHGTLTIDAQGNYSYAPMPGTGGGGTDVFTYQITDGDGDTSTATLTITLPDLPATIDSVPTTGAGTVVDEEGLPARPGETQGSNEPANVEATTGTITFSTPDGFGSLQINGTTVTGAGQTITLPNGTFQVDSFNPGAGTLTYTFTLTDNTGGDNTSVTLTVTVTDADGDSDSEPFTINIIDDVPDAIDDAAQSVAEDAAGTIGGNVLTNDVQGADGATVTSVTIGGTAHAVAATGTTTVTAATGTYTITAAGVWTFDPATGLNQTNGPVDASFTYTITDGDGDTDSALQPIDVTDGAPPRAGAPITLTVDDENLANGSSPAVPVTDADTITFTGGSDPIASIAFGTDLTGLGGGLTWTRVDGDTIVGKDGADTIVTLELTVAGNDATITATLSNNYDSHPGINVDDLADLGSVGVVATDIDGTSATGTVNVAVSDDLPVANDDSASQVGEDANVTIDVFANDVPGADGALASSVALVPGSQVGAGVLTNNGNGTFTLDPAPGQTGQVTFQYTFVDGDGDIAQATATITLLADSTPSAAPATNLIVDEDGLAGHNVDASPLQVSPSETDSTESATQSGTVVVSFGNDVPAPANQLAAFTLLDTAGLDGQLVALNGTPVTFALGTGVDAGVLIGKAGATEVIRITVTGVVAGPGAGQLTYSYSTLLSQPVQHTGQGEGTDLLSGISFQVSDSDGDPLAAPGTFSVTVVDDVTHPIITQNGIVNNVAGATGTFDLDGDGNIDNNVGADQAGSVTFPTTLEGPTGLTSNGAQIFYHVSIDGKTFIATTSATDPFLNLGNTTAWVFKVDLLQDNSLALSNDDYTVTTYAPIDSRSVVDFTEGGYDFLGGNTHWIGFVPLGEENTPVPNLSSDLLLTPIINGDTANGNANEMGSGGAGGGSLAVGPNQGLRLDFVKDLTGDPTSGGGGYVAPSNHDFSGHYTVPGVSIEFAIGGNATNRSTIKFVAWTDTDAGNPDAVGEVVTFEQISSVIITFGAKTASLADDATFTIDTTTVGTDTYTYLGTDYTVTKAADGTVSVQGVANGATVAVFTDGAFTTLEARHDGGAEWTITGIATSVLNNQPATLALPIQLSDADGDIASSYIDLTFKPPTGTQQGTNLTSTAAQPNLLGTDGNDTLTGNDGVNWISGGKGADQLTGGLGADTFVIDPSHLTAGAGDTITDFAPAVDLIDLRSLFDSMGTLAPTTAVQAAAVTRLVGNQLQVDVDGTGAGSTFVTVATLSNNPASVNILWEFNQTFITENASPPVVLDLDGDGVEFAGVSAGTTFDFDGDGIAEATAWAGSDDGVLAIDLNGDGQITEASEIAFGSDGLTDLQGLAESYDSNADGVLDAQDAAFDQFGVLQGGHFVSLADAGIASIGLTSDGQAYSAANGEVFVHGTGTYTRTDGTTGSFADAAFATAPIERRTAEVVTTAAAATALLASVDATAGQTLATADEPLERTAADATFGQPEPATSLVHEPTAQTAQIEAANDLALPEHRSTSNPTEADAAPAFADAGQADDGDSYDAGADNSSDPVADFGGASSAFFQGDTGGAMMDALLAIGAGAPQPEGLTTQDLAPVRDALVEVEGEAFVNAVVDHFAPGAEGAVATGGGDAGAYAALLQTIDVHQFIASSGQLTAANEDAAAMAAAQA